ncbi:MAG: very short patch repair endonuclease [Candidatus Omnitrophica bacterium]|nr:very short patch repair endonuclease [Candidatus Omnitrophota bacterium]
MFRFVTSPQRSSLMRKIRSKNTSPELCFVKALRQQKIKYSRSNQKIIGKPDIVIKAKKIAIFIDGSFWHGFDWRKKKLKIKANRAYWIPKIEKNILRDKKNNKALLQAGWAVIRFWEDDIKINLPMCLRKLKKTME